ncbi:MAG: hypothetical protein JWQ30_628 [Sediminibacterium sp.]|nr:hypothetical protein [Sediminibacterium sp.]
MAIQHYKIELTGQGNLIQPEVKLEGNSIHLTSSNGGVKWTNNDVQVDVPGQLHVFMSCNGINHTAWAFTVTNKSDSHKAVDESGVIGDKSSGYSEITKTVNP